MGSGHGNSTVYGYDQKGQVSQVLEDLDGDGAYSAGDRLTSYDGQYIGYNGQTVFQSTTTIRGFGGTADLADSVLSAISGMDVWEKVGSLPVSHSSFGYTGAGAAVRKDIAADGASTIQTFANGILADVKQVGRGGKVIQQESYGHDGLLRINSVTGPFGTTTIDLRSNGTAQGATYSDNRTEQTTQNNPATYDPTQYQRADGGIINMPENSQHQTTSVSGAGQLPTSFGYDPNTGQQTSLTTFRGDTTFEGGELSGSNSATTSWAYDPNTGLLASKSYEGSADPDIFYGYDNLRLSQINRPGSNETLIWSGTDLDGVQYNGDQLASDVEQRDSFGRVTRQRQQMDLDVSDGQSFTLLQDWTTDYSYTANGDLASESLPQLGSGFSTSYGYYPSTSSTPDFLQSVSILNGTQSQLSIKYEYDPSSHRLQKITDPMESFSYSYKANTDLVESVSSRNGTKTSYSYEEDTGRLHSVTITKGIQTLYSETFTYNTNDQIETAAITQLQPDGTSKHYTYTYSYDQYDQLTDAYGTTTNSRGSTVFYNEFTYDFDSAGNPSADMGYTTNSRNQITHVAGITGTFTYDSRGNLTFDGQFHYVYSPQDRPVLEYDGTTELMLSYDSQGKRTSKAIYRWNPNQGQYVLQETRTFAYDGWNIIAEYQQVPGKDRHLLHSYIWDPKAALGGLLSVTDYSTGEAKPYRVQSNYRGDVIGLTDALGNVVATYEYDPFGNQISASGSAGEVCPFRGQSQYLDEQTGVRVFALRDEKFNRFIERDPSGEASDVNLYRLDGDDPVNFGDPDGMNAVPKGTRFTDLGNGAMLIENPNGSAQVAVKGMLLPFLMVSGRDNVAEARNMAAEIISPPPTMRAMPPTTIWQSLRTEAAVLYNTATNVLNGIVTAPESLFYDRSAMFRPPQHTAMSRGMRTAVMGGATFFDSESYLYWKNITGTGKTPAERSKYVSAPFQTTVLDTNALPYADKYELYLTKTANAGLAISGAYYGGLGLRSGAVSVPPNAGTAVEGSYVNLVSGDRSIHILYGDATGGGHLWPGLPEKTPFPESWSAPKILNGVSDIVTDPTVSWTNQTGKPGSFFTNAGDPARWKAIVVRDGVRIKVIYEPAGEGVITAHPIR